MRKSIVYILCLLSMSGFAQIKPISTHFNFFNELYNPAFIGVNEDYKISANYRAQWTNLNGAPQLFNFISGFYLPTIKSGIGLNLANDRIGAFNITTVQFGYNYIVAIKQKVKIGIGAQVGIEAISLDASKLITPNGDYNGGINHNDVILGTTKNKSIRPNLNIGISLLSKNINIGLGYINTINNPLKLESGLIPLSTKFGGVFTANIYSEIKLNDNFKLQPAFLLNTDFKNFQTDIQLLVKFRDYVALGTNVRGSSKSTFESIAPLVSFNPIKKLLIAYSYDINLNQLNVANNGSHEITISFNMKSKKLNYQPKYINNPRFL